MHVRVHIRLKKGVLDPTGKAIETSLSSLGFNGVSDVHVGKVIEFSTDETDRDKALAYVDDMCKKLLANTVIEDYEIELD